ncbi:hypothetical protein TBLA_0A08580 [Henningerozyma blattae CBS 6284]|uniref:Proteasome assembly chaperone 2 n=1 Tax=Henningerozyma blattae (strain ATCC 34711 / CBS 6284 / DSM 70876 / NBRC 10599 / NRRL Y-10934 / UCD 77-7) TaxID=1071380 RepID=I2GWZ6_HENB6|nr:hypothetical protein TBLA_0A08580 [Tetrapisispora blattae CBS 6284]CCH58648.1 hypothetical protein TBLA_0A08580 [Tetrapisispora blattae CBS 6284]
MPSLILPLVSTANVPQLTVDLLLHSTTENDIHAFKHIKSYSPETLLSFLGPVDKLPIEKNSSSSIYPNNQSYSTSFELFYNQSTDTYLIQQRTPIITGYLNTFINKTIVPIVNQYQIDNVILLDSHSPRDENYLINNDNADATIKIFSYGTCELPNLSEEILRELNNLSLSISSQETNELIESKIFQMTKQSLLKDLSTCQDAWKYSIDLIRSPLSESLKSINYFAMFVNEGDNSMDAKLFINYLKENLSTELKNSIKFNTPISWEGLYGKEMPDSFDQGIYI